MGCLINMNIKKHIWLMVFVSIIMSFPVFAQLEQGYYTFRDMNGVVIHAQVTSKGVNISFIPEKGWDFYSYHSQDSEQCYFVKGKYSVAISNNYQFLLLGSTNNMSKALKFYVFNPNSDWNDFNISQYNNQNVQKTQPCYTCHGTGQCVVCHGSGTYSNYGYSTPCTACGGTGKCWRCHGTGIE